MRRVEIIFSQSLEEDLLAAFKAIPEASFYTTIPVAHGRGHSTPKMGDAVWPEINKIMILYVEEERTVEAIRKGVAEVQKNYPNEGCAIFVI